MARKERKTFEDTLAEVRVNPSRGPRVPAGRRGRYWGDLEGHRYELVTDELRPEEAAELARNGATIVYDRCGCGGTECTLDWLSASDTRQLAETAVPVLHSSKNGRADLEHWHSADGRDLIVAAVEVSWGARIRG